MSEYLTTSEASQYLKVTQRVIARWVIDGNLPNYNTKDPNNLQEESFKISPYDVLKIANKKRTVKQAAKILGIKEASLRQQMSRGAIAYIKINGGSYIYDIEIKSYRKFRGELFLKKL